MPESAKPQARIAAIDALRGLVIVLMALDHSRDFFGDIRIRPEAIDSTTVPLFFTRWVTHLCAPTFVFLAGVSAWLHGEKLKDSKRLAAFLITRGLWLIILEFTVVRFGLLFSMTLGPGMFLVIAAIGAAMVLLGLCCLLPTMGVSRRVTILVIGATIILLHNMLDGVETGQLGALGGLWTLLMRPGYVAVINTFVGYPVLPWFGLMALGFGLAKWLTQTTGSRRRFAATLGLVFVGLFLLLRASNFYGDSQQWSWQSNSRPELTSVETAGSADGIDNTDATAADGSRNWRRTMFSFLATSKYPPSLLFVLMTIGPSLMLLSFFDGCGKDHWLVRFLKVFGSVPLFFYVVHFYLLHLGAWLLYWVFKGKLISPMHIDVVPEMPPEYGFNGPGWLIQVYVGWVIVLAILFPACLWYRKRKRLGKSKFWSYL